MNKKNKLINSFDKLRPVNSEWMSACVYTCERCFAKLSVHSNQIYILVVRSSHVSIVVVLHHYTILGSSTPLWPQLKTVYPTLPLSNHTSNSIHIQFNCNVLFIYLSITFEANTGCQACTQFNVIRIILI